MPYAHDSNLDTFDFIISDVSSGSYALILFDDLNGNRFLDKNLLGIPLEPVGASNNPSYRFGPPRFDECLFELSEPLARVLIKVVD